MTEHEIYSANVWINRVSLPQIGKVTLEELLTTRNMI